MDESYRQMIDFLVEFGTEKVGHTDKTYLAHLIAVHRDLKKWGCEEFVCLAGMFHSIYGTEKFQSFSLPLDRRAEVRQLIGQRAEYLAYVNCMMDRDSFDRALEQDCGPYKIDSRLLGEEIEISQEDFAGLCRVHLCDWLEQVPRSREWDYRRDSYRRMAERLGGPAQESYDCVFAEYEEKV